jgi:sugar phosphate isomerase/epimerase
MLLPGDMKLTGPSVDRDALSRYMQFVIRRAHAIGCHTLVFGSGAARRAPDGFDPRQAETQIVEFLKSVAPLANQFQVTLVVEPLNRDECNVINRVSHAMRVIERVAHPNVRLLFDSYHAWVEDDSLDALEDVMPYLRHVHLADEQGRVPPGESGECDYRPLFTVLKRHGYRGLLSVESPGFDIVKAGDRVLDFLNEQMRDA